MNALAIIFFLVIPWLVGAAIGFAVMDVLTDLVRFGLSRLQRVLVTPQANQAANRSHR